MKIDINLSNYYGVWLVVLIDFWRLHQRISSIVIYTVFVVGCNSGVNPVGIVKV